MRGFENRRGLRVESVAGVIVASCSEAAVWDGNSVQANCSVTVYGTRDDEPVVDRARRTRPDASHAEFANVEIDNVIGLVMADSSGRTA